MVMLAGVLLALDTVLVISCSRESVDILLLVGRLLVACCTMLLASRFAKSQWPWGQGTGREIRRATPLLETSAISEEQLKRNERGVKCFSWLLSMSFLYISSCSLWIATRVVQLHMSDFWSGLAAVLNILVLLIMQLEHVFVKSFVEELCAGEALHLSLHEHPLYWRNVENKGFVECSVCNEKVGEKTGGYLVVQCRKCTPNQWGHGGFQVCTRCYRKNAKASSTTSGLLWGDKGPKHPTQLTVRQYMYRLASQVQAFTLLMLALSVICSQCLNAYIPKAQGEVITALTSGSEEDFDRCLLAFACLVVAQALAATALDVASRGLGTRLFSQMSLKLFDALLKQDIAFYDHMMTGQLSARLTMDLGQATSPVHIIIHDFAANIVMLLVGFGICLQSSWRLTLLAFTVLSPLGHLSREFSCWAQKLMASQYTFNCDAQGCAVQALTNIRTVRVFGAREIELEKFQMQMQKYRDVGLKVAWGEGCANLLSSLVQQGACFMILWYGGRLALKEEFEIGSIVTFTYMWNRLSGSFASLTDNLNEPVKAMSAGQRVFELLDLQPDIREEEGDSFPEAEVAIHFKDVEFQYPTRRTKKVLAGVSLAIQAGKTTAVVGRSGSGKSTLSKLLLRFYDPSKGKVFINGTDLQQLHLLSYRARLGVVSQDTQLFRCSVTENIAYGLHPTEYTTQDVERAAMLANADEFIRCLPDGYSTILCESGQDLSGGQKQRLSIARALVRQPRILLLDEATSALDAENEAIVQQALDSLMEQMQGACTILVIAHRLSTIKNADRIIVLSEGEIVEEGKHSELLDKKGSYASMIARQLDEGPKTAEQVMTDFNRLIKSIPQQHLEKVLADIVKVAEGMMS